jgi:hypothetical protein
VKRARPSTVREFLGELTAERRSGNRLTGRRVLHACSREEKNNGSDGRIFALPRENPRSAVSTEIIGP